MIAAIAASVGTKKVKHPDPDASRADFDKWLNAEPKRVDPEKYELMRELGVA